MRRNLKDLKSKLRKFAKARDWDKYHSPKNLSMGLSVEASELLEHFLWLETHETVKPRSKKHGDIKEEIGDVLIYIVRLSDKLNIDPLTAAYEKLEKNKLKYPVAKCKGSCKKYNEL